MGLGPSLIGAAGLREPRSQARLWLRAPATTGCHLAVQRGEVLRPGGGCWWRGALAPPQPCICVLTPPPWPRSLPLQSGRHGSAVRQRAPFHTRRGLIGRAPRGHQPLRYCLGRVPSPRPERCLPCPGSGQGTASQAPRWLSPSPESSCPVTNATADAASPLLVSGMPAISRRRHPCRHAGTTPKGAGRGQAPPPPRRPAQRRSHPRP